MTPWLHSFWGQVRQKGPFRGIYTLDGTAPGHPHSLTAPLCLVFQAQPLPRTILSPASAGDLQPSALSFLGHAHTSAEEGEVTCILSWTGATGTLPCSLKVARKSESSDGCGLMGGLQRRCGAGKRTVPLPASHTPAFGGERQ